MVKQLGIVCTSPGYGGLEMFTLELARGLQQKGWKVFFLLNEKSELWYLAKDAFPTASVQELGKEKNHASLIKKWNTRHQLKLLFTPYNKDLKPLASYKRFYQRNLKLVYQQHMKVGVKKRDLIHRLRYNMLDLWITPLAYLKQETLERTTVPENKIAIAPVGLNFDKLRESPLSRKEARTELCLSQDAFIIGILGRIDPKKGHDFLIKAIASLKEKQVHLLIMGAATAHEGQEWMSHLQQLVAASAIADRVQFRSYQQDISLFYQSIDVFAMASHGETYGLVTLEAFFYEKPVIGVNTDGTKALLEGGRLGWLYELEDMEGFKQQLRSIQTKDQEVQDKIKKAKEVVLNQYDLNLTIDQIDGLLTSIIY